MSSVIVAGDTSGSVTLQAPAVAGTTVLTLPATTGTVLTTTGGVVPGTSGNVLTSNGTAWTSATPATTTAYRIRVLTSGTTYTKPSDVKSLYAFVYGATGANGSIITNGSIGGNGYSETYYASPAASYSYTIGAAGVGTSAGGSTTFGAMSVTSSAGTATATGSTGGVGSGGTFNATGGSGGNSGANSGGSGGAGSRAGNGGNGGLGGTLYGGGGGTGGNAGSNSPAATTQGAAATVKAAEALTLPWATNETFQGGVTGSVGIGAPSNTGFTNNEVYWNFVAYGTNTTQLPTIGKTTGATNIPYGANPSPGIIYLVEVL